MGQAGRIGPAGTAERRQRGAGRADASRDGQTPASSREAMFRSAAKRLRPVARGLGAAAAAGVGVAGAGQLHAQAERLPVAPPAGAPVALAAAADTQPAEPYEQLLYPAVEPFATARHETSDGHSLYYEQVGNPSGVPILFVHGGPGNGCGINDRRFFDPEYFRVILVDQRGCARSTPLGNLENNNIDALCDDFEAIREALGIEAWHVFGGSWGSTLSLYYAQQHPARCLSLTLRGIFLMRDQDVDYWMYQVLLITPTILLASGLHSSKSASNIVADRSGTPSRKSGSGLTSSSSRRSGRTCTQPTCGC